MTNFKPSTYAGMIGLTSTLWLLLYGLMHYRLEPVLLGAPPQELRGLAKEAYPYLSIVGSMIWIALIALYAFACGRLLAPAVSLPRRSDSSWLALGLFVISLLFVVTVHPNLLVTLVRPDQRSNFAHFLEEYCPVLDQLYFHWGFQRFELWFPLAHALVVTLLILVYDLIRGSAVRTRR